MEINARNYKAIQKKVKAEEPFSLHWKCTAGHEKKMVDRETMKVLTVEEVTNYYEEGCATYTEGDMWAVVTTGNQKMQAYMREKNRQKPGSVRQTGYIHCIGMATYRVLLRDWEAWEAELCQRAMEADNVVQVAPSN